MSPLIGNEMQHFEIPSFRVKRAHKKSRLGCVRCKRRRVKCDETRPACRQCKRRGLSCPYEERAVWEEDSPDSRSSLDVAPLSPSDSSVSDAEVMRHFFAHTGETFVTTSVKSAHVELWKVVIPALSYSHSPVRLGLLTAGALCMHYDSLSEPELARKYFDVAESHGERFVMESRLQARRLDALEVDSILACARLLTTLGFAFYRTHRANGVTLGDAAAWTWLHLLRGVKTIYAAILESGAEIDPIMSINMAPEIQEGQDLCGTPTTGMQWHRMHEHFYLVQDSQRERFESLFAGLLSRKADFSPEEATDMYAAIVSLERITKHICTGEVHSVLRAICTWPGSLSTGFVDSLLRNEPFALVVYAHWLMIVALARDMWWFDDMGVACIREIAAICSRNDSSMDTMMEWPMKMLDAAM